MTFYRHDPEMASNLKKLIYRFEQEGRSELNKNISITWICYKSDKPEIGTGIGAGWQSNKLFYPASIVKIVYAIALEAWLQKDLIIECSELRRATYEMIANSNNDATSYIVDLLTGTSSGTSLTGKQKLYWDQQRQLINKWLKTLDWIELEGINCNQKTWNQGPYGREKDFYGANNENRNKLSTSATARLLEAVMTNGILSPIATKRIQNLLSRSLDLAERKSNPENQIDGFLGEGLSLGTKLWSKAGLMSEVRHDAAWWCAPNKNPMLVVVFTSNKNLSKDPFLLPAISNELNKLV